MNEKKICFITCVNDQIMYDECIKYIENLDVPEGFEVEYRRITEAKSMASGYNEGMKSSDAKYKIYLHQDVFIINKNFIYDVINTFNSNMKIGMLGVIEDVVIPKDGALWNSYEKNGEVYDNSRNGVLILNKFKNISAEYLNVNFISGLIMITQYDVMWREDIFDGWEFYNISQSTELKKIGYEVIIPNQDSPWCIHDCGLARISNDYDKYRNVFIEEYSSYLISMLNENILDGKFIGDRKIVSLRNMIYEKVPTKACCCKLIDEYLMKKYNIEINDKNGLFDFDELKALQVLLENREAFNKYISDAKQYLSIGDYESSVKAVFEAGKLSYSYHPGMYTSYDAEIILLECSKVLPSLDIKINFFGDVKSKRKVLHVLSEGYSIGGHTRLAANWITKDTNSIHSLITTWQSDTLPQWIKDSVANSGGGVYSLALISNSYLGRAAALRKIAYEWADVVVLHVHPYDPIPIMAFGIAGGPPVIYMNHADHCFWLGSCISDVVANIRDSAEELTVERRGNANTAILPIPLLNKINKDSMSKIDVRREFGIDKKSIVFLTIASEYKFNKINQWHFTEILKMISKIDNVVFLIIGPQPKGIWLDIINELNGKVKVLGSQCEIEKFYNCADIYLDSYPISSMTATIDAGLHKLNIVGLMDKRYITCTNDDAAIRNCYYDNLNDYLNHINEIINNFDVNKNNIDTIYNNINNYHNLLWTDYLNNVYKKAEKDLHNIHLVKKSDKINKSDLFFAFFQRTK